MLRKLKRSCLDVLIKVFYSFLIERWSADTEFIQNCTDAIPVDAFAVRHFGHYLRGEISMGTNERI